MNGVRVTAKARHWGGSAALAVVLGILGLVHSEYPVAFPLIYGRLPLRSLIAVFAVPVALYPLHDWFPGFSATLASEPALRPMRVLACFTLVFVALAPAVLAPAAQWAEARTDVNLAVALTTIGLLALSAVGDYSWLVVLGVGFTSFIIDGAPTAPITHLFATPISAAIALALLAAASLIYARQGPRRRGA